MQQKNADQFSPTSVWAVNTTLLRMAYLFVSLIVAEVRGTMLYLPDLNINQWEYKQNTMMGILPTVGLKPDLLPGLIDS